MRVVKTLKDTDACGVLGVLDRYLPPNFSGSHHSSSHAGKLAADISDIAVYDDRNILECWRTRRRERKPQGHKPVLNAPRVLRWPIVGNAHLELKVQAALYFIFYNEYGLASARLV